MLGGALVRKGILDDDEYRKIYWVIMYTENRKENISYLHIH